MLWEVILWHHYLFADKPRCCGGFRKRQTCIAIVTSVAVIIGYLIWLYWKFEMLDATFWHLFMYLLPVQIVAGCAIVFFHRYRRFGGSG